MGLSLYFTSLSSDVEDFFIRYRGNFAVQPKIDGEDLIVVRTLDDKVYAFNRYSTYYYDLPFLESLPHYPIVLRGEMHVPNGKVYDVRRTVKVAPHTLVLTVHDILYYQGDLRSLPLSDRLKALEKVFSSFTLSQQLYGGIRLIESKVAASKDDVMEYFRKYVSLGYEGVVVKPLSSRYLDNVWLKVKKKITYDVMITAVKLKRDGSLSWSFRMEAYRNGKLVHVGDVSSGLSGEDRLLLHSHITGEVFEDEGETYVRLDKPFVAEVEAQEVSENGKLRHPVALRIRYDKPLIECTI